MEVKNKYQTAKIYTIRSPHTDKYYIGSTANKYLCNRLAGHKSNYKQYLTGDNKYMTSFDIIKLGDVYIELLELVKCNSNDELHKREGELIREHKNNCVNNYVAGRTGKELIKESPTYHARVLENNKKSRERNKEKNREKINERSRIYYRLNKEMVDEKRRKRYQLNKDNKTT